MAKKNTIKKIVKKDKAVLSKPRGHGTVYRPADKDVRPRGAFTHYHSFSRGLVYFLVVLIPVFYLPWTVDALELNKMFLFGLTILLASLSTLINFFIKRDWQVNKLKPLWPWLLFLLFYLLATIGSVDRYQSLIGVTGYYHHTLPGIGLWLLLVLLVIYNFTKNDISKLLGLLLLSLTSGAVVALSQLLDLKLLPWLADQGTNVNLFTASYNNLLIITAVAVILALYFLTVKTNFWLWRTLAVIALIVNLSVIGLVDFNLGWYLLLTVLLLQLVFVIRAFTQLKFYHLVLPLILVAFALVLISVNASYFTHRQFLPDINLNQGTTWQIVKAAWAKNYLLGSGPENFTYDFNRYRPAAFNDSNYWQLNFNKAASEFWQLVDTVGPLAVTALILAVLWLLVKLFVASKAQERKYSFFHLIIIVLVFFLVTFFVVSLTLVPFFLFWFFCALGYLALDNKPVKKELSANQTVVLPLAFSLIFIAMIFYAFFGWRIYAAEVKLHQAINLAAAKEKNYSQIEQYLAQAMNLNNRQSVIYFTWARVILNQLNSLETQASDYSTVVKNLLLKLESTVTNILALNYNYAPNYWQAGQILESAVKFNGNYLNSALTMYQQASNRDQKNALYYNKLGQIDYTLAGWPAKQLTAAATEEVKAQATKQQTEWLNQAETNFDQAIKLKQNFLEAKLNLALTYEQQTKIQAATNVFNDLLAQASANFDLWYEYGSFFVRQNNADQALTAFKQAVKLRPQNANAHYALAELYGQTGQGQLALAEYQLVDKLAPGDKQVQAKIEKLQQAE